MKHCRLTDIRSLDQLYNELARQLGFPPHFGRNLDALWDVLTTDIEGPLEIVWENPELSRAGLGDDYARLVALFEEAAAERGDMTLEFPAKAKLLG
ncbi:MAG: barstar family protein [Sulfuricellaceae bacterium]